MRYHIKDVCWIKVVDVKQIGPPVFLAQFNILEAPFGTLRQRIVQKGIKEYQVCV